MVEFDYKELYSDIKKHGKVIEIVKEINMTDSGLRRQIAVKQMWVHNLIKICSIIGKHPCDYFSSDENYRIRIAEPEMQRYLLKHEENISTLLEMRNEEVKYLKGQINSLEEQKQALKNEIEMLRKKL